MRRAIPSIHHGPVRRLFLVATRAPSHFPIVFTLVALLACSGGRDRVGTGPVTFPYDGQWSGTTSQGETISFTVARHYLATLRLDFALEGSCMFAPTFAEFIFRPRVQPIVNGAFSVTGTTAISGTFGTTTSASGSFSVNSAEGEPPGCVSTATGTWTAAK